VTGQPHNDDGFGSLPEEKAFCRGTHELPRIPAGPLRSRLLQRSNSSVDKWNRSSCLHLRGDGTCLSSGVIARQPAKDSTSSFKGENARKVARSRPFQSRILLRR
jgi:hypothetical protein